MAHISQHSKYLQMYYKKTHIYKLPNFARCVALLKKGQVDVIAGLNPSPERDEFSFYAIFKAADELRVVSKEGITINDYSDFHGKIIGISRGASYFPRFDNNKKLKKLLCKAIALAFHYC